MAVALSQALAKGLAGLVVLQWVVSTYQFAKNIWSTWFGGPQRAALPTLTNVEQVNEVVQKLKYTGDPWNGIGDFTHTPEHLYWCVLESTRDPNFRWPSIDCDDYAELARGLCRKMGIRAERWILVDVKSMVWTHVICMFRLGQKYGTIDTNGLNWHESKDAVKKFFETVYNIRYHMASGE